MYKSPTSPVVHLLRANPLNAAGCALILAALLLAPLAIAACSSSPGKSEATPVAEVSPTPPPRTGQEIFASTCAACHGAAGEGQPNWHIRNEDGTLPAPPLNGTGHTWHHPDGWLYRVVSQGGKIQESPSVPGFKSAMPAFGETFSDDEIIDVLTYVKSLWGDRISRSGLSITESQAFISENDPYPTGGN